MAALSAALERAERHGAPLAETLAAQAAEARAAHARRLHEQAAKAAPKIQLVVALLLVPSVMLLVAAALVASLGHVRGPPAAGPPRSGAPMSNARAAAARLHQMPVRRLASGPRSAHPGA